MTSTLLLIACIICVNFFCLLMIWSSQLTDEVKPKFISSTYDPKATIDFDSMVLKSLNKLISKYFQEPSIITKHVGDLPIGNNTQYTLDLHYLNQTFSQFKPNYHSKYYMMFNNDKSLLRILETAKIIPSEGKYDYHHNQISLYVVSTDNFLINYKSEFNLSKSLIHHCWSSKFPGKIMGTVVSNDKNSIAITYRVIKGNVITYRIRYISNLLCDEKTHSAFNQLDNLIYSSFDEYINSNLHVDNIYKQGEDKRNDEKFTSFFFLNDTYDDFALTGNTPVTAMGIQRDTIAFSRDMDFNSFYVIKKNATLNEWFIVFKGPPINKAETYYYHTNSIKFMADDKVNDIKMIQVYLTINSSSTSLITDIIKANYSLNEFNTTKSVLRKIDEELISSYTYDIDNIIQHLKKYLKPTAYSNGNGRNYVLELFYGTVCYFGWDDDELDHAYVLTTSNRQIDKIASDTTNENIIIKYEKGEFVYLYRKNKTKEYDSNYEQEKTIVFNSLPRKYRTKSPISFLIEKFDNKTILLMLMEEGVVLSLNFTKIVEREKSEKWVDIFNEYNYTVLTIILGNIISVIVYFKIFRNRRTVVEENQRRAPEVNQVIQELNRLNEVHNQNVQELQGEQISNNPNNNEEVVQQHQHNSVEHNVDNNNEGNQHENISNINQENHLPLENNVLINDNQPQINTNNNQDHNNIVINEQNQPSNNEEDPLLENIMNEYC